MSNALICGLATAPLMVRGSSFNERCALLGALNDPAIRPAVPEGPPADHDNLLEMLPA